MCTSCEAPVAPGVEDLMDECSLFTVRSEDGKALDSFDLSVALHPLLGALKVAVEERSRGKMKSRGLTCPASSPSPSLLSDFSPSPSL